MVVFNPDKILPSLFEMILSCWFFRSEYHQEESLGWKLLSLVPLLALAPLVMDAGFAGSMSLRFFYRWLVLLLCLLLLERRDFKRCLYLACLCTLSFAAEQNLLILSRAATRAHVADPVLHFVFVILLEYALPFLIFTWVSRSIDFPRVIAFKGHQIVMLALLIPPVLYAKTNFFLLSINQPGPLTLASVAYPLIISMLVLIIIASYDRFWQLRSDREERLVLDVARQYQYKNLLDQAAAQEESRAIIHDIRNHLLSLSATAGKAQETHISELLEAIDSTNLHADTGNETLDAILVQKQREAITKHIRMVADLDLRPAIPLGPMDTISVFANALDNAIEAAERVPEQEDRYIHLRGGQVANLYVLRITNSCSGQLHLREDGLLQTHKEDDKHHGLGLRSMRRSLNKLNGNLSFEQKNGCFILNITLPLRQD